VSPPLKPLLVVALLAAAIAAKAGSAAPPPPGRWVVLHTSSVTNDYPVVLITWNVPDPKAVAVRVIGPSNEPLTASWNAYCSHGLATEGKRGTFSGRGVAMKVVTLPVAHAGMCTIGGGARLTRGPAIGARRSVSLQIQVLALR
jgi:hypothetical protein